MGWGAAASRAPGAEFRRPAAWAGEAPPDEAGARHLYVHVPFCLSRCGYCDFASEPLGPHLRAGRVARYMEALRAEFETRAHLLASSLETVYLGGGTPTALSPKLLLPWVSRLGRRLAPGGELTVEANPGTIDAGMLAGLAAAGVTRLSVGVQSFSARLRRNLGRRTTDEQIAGALAMVRQAGWTDWNVDLVFGIPGQEAEAARDVQRAVAAGPTHVSLYDLTYTEAYARWVKARLGEGARERAEAFAETAYSEAVARLEAAGYRRYEVSNFALPGHECRHNMAYWRGRDYVGLGASAVSTAGLERWRNPPSVCGYLGGDEPDREALTPQVRLFERAMLGLRTIEGVSEEDVGPVLDTALLDALVERGLVLRRCATLSLSSRGLDVSSAVLAAILSPPGSRAHPRGAFTP